MSFRGRFHSGLVLAACALSMACTLVLQRDTGQCESHADCQALGPDYLCASDQICVRFDVGRTGTSALDAGSCRQDADCVGLGLALCRRGACLPLNAPEHGCASSNLGTTSPSDGSAALVVGMLAKRNALYPALFELQLAGPVRTAINELNRARSEANPSVLPALVGVVCDETAPSAAEYLVSDLKVDLLLGPTDSNRVEPLLSQIGDQALLWAPFADGPNLQVTSGAPASWLVSCKPNRAGMRTYFLSAVAEVQSLLPEGVALGSSVIAISGDVATTTFVAGINALALEAAGLRAVPYTAAPRGRGLLSALEGIRPYPSLVVAASAEDNWGENIAALDQASFASTGTYPYYFLSEKRFSTQAQTILDQATADGSLPQYRRLMGVDYHRGAPSTRARTEFEVAHRAEMAADPEPGFEYAYDCAYLAVYAALAASQRFSLPVSGLPPAALASGVSALMGTGALVPIGASTVGAVIESIISNRGGAGSVNLIGASGDLELVGDIALDSAVERRRYLAPRTPDGELYCVDANTKAFCDTGTSFSANEGLTTRASTSPCACLGVAP